MQTDGIPDHAAKKEPNVQIATIRKAVAAACGVAAQLVSAGVLDGKAEAVVSGLLAVATAYGVWAVPNKHVGPTV